MIFFIFTTILFFCLCLVEAYYLFKFSRIILAIEDDLADAIETFENTQKSIEKILKMQLFFESKEVKYVVEQTLQGIKISQMALVQLINNFTKLSRQKYELVRINNAEEDEDEENDDLIQ